MDSPINKDMLKRKSALEKDVRKKDERVAAVLAELSASGEGQFFLRWLMDETGAFKQEFAPDDRTALFYAGRRSFGLQVLEKCAAVGVAHTLLTRRTPE